MTRHHSDRFHTFNLLNMALGALVFAVAVYLMVTGEYDNLQLRQQAEALLGRLEVGAPLYVVLFWYLDRFVRPLWYSASAQMH
jgi:hypothetical protein